MATKLIIDTPNILFRVASQNAKHTFGTDEERAGLAMHVAFQSMHKHFKSFKPDQLVFAFEGTKNWRKTYTQDDSVCISGNKYKGNRVRDKSMEPFFELVNSFREVMHNHSAAICLSEDHCEADDIIAGFCQLYANGEDEIIVVSGDKDFIQLLQYPNVRLIDPQTGKDEIIKSPKHVDHVKDTEWFLFEKSIRGDKGDNVLSAFPRVRSTRIRKAYDDEYERVQFMNEEWSIETPDGIKKTFRVGDLVAENRLLVDLSMQPSCVQRMMYDAIKHGVANPGNFSNFHFMKFLGKYGLQNIADNIHLYMNMLSCTPTYTPPANVKLAVKNDSKLDRDLYSDVKVVEDDRRSPSTGDPDTTAGRDGDWPADDILGY